MPDVWINPETGGVESTVEWQQRLNAGDPDAHRQLADLARTPPDLSPFPPDSFHRKLASFTERDLRLELGLRWAYGLAHVVNTGTDPYDGSKESWPQLYMRELTASFVRDITGTLEKELPLEFAKQYARQFAAAIAEMVES